MTSQIEDEVEKKANQEKESQKVISDNKLTLEDSIASEANMKLVQDLKTISVALQKKQDEKINLSKIQQLQELDQMTKKQAEVSQTLSTTDASKAAVAAASSDIKKDELLKSATQTLDGLLNNPTLKDIEPL